MSTGFTIFPHGASYFGYSNHIFVDIIDEIGTQSIQLQLLLNQSSKSSCQARPVRGERITVQELVFLIGIAPAINFSNHRSRYTP